MSDTHVTRVTHATCELSASDVFGFMDSVPRMAQMGVGMEGGRGQIWEVRGHVPVVAQFRELANIG